MSLADKHHAPEQEETANQIIQLRAGTVVLIRGIPMRLVEDVRVESHRNNFRAAGL